MPRYKRTADEAGFLDVKTEPERPTEELTTLRKLRNMWQFASLMQYIFLFGHVVKISEDFDIEDLEAECVKQTSERIANIGLALLKYVSSHRGLTLEIFDEYTRRQYMAKAPQRNPFGEEEDPNKFSEFDIYTKIKVLHQLSIWTFGNVDRIRSLMPQEEDHLDWRMEPVGWDKEDRAYFVLDDNRLYRRADELPPAPSPKRTVKSNDTGRKKGKSRATRASKRRKIEDTDDDEPADDDDEAENMGNESAYQTRENGEAEEPQFGFTSKTWECVAITLEEYQEFMASIFRSRDPNEKQLRVRIEQDVIPIIEKRAEALRQKQLKKWRELENLQKMATAKRSSRIADKADREKQEREEHEAEEKRQRDLQMARDEQERQKRVEEGHESRRLTREQRVREREAKRIIHEEELARLEEDELRAASQDPNTHDGDAKRISERQLKTQREQHKKELEKLAAEQSKWDFDCSVCGMHGQNLDDGTHSIACDRCNVWQHSKCHGFSPKQAESEDFVFVCSTCKRKEEEAAKPKIPPLKLNKSKQSNSPEIQMNPNHPTAANGDGKHNLPDHVARQLDGAHGQHMPRPSPGPFGQLINGPSLSPSGQSQGPPGYSHHPEGFVPQRQPQAAWQGSSLPPPPRQPSNGYVDSPPSQTLNGRAPVQHHQQHQYAHQQGLVAAGAPTPYRIAYSPSPQHLNGHSPPPPAGSYYKHPMQPQYSNAAPFHPATHQSPDRQQAVNGYQSPSPSQHRAQFQVTPQGYTPTAHQPLHRSPSTSFPPPTQSRQQQLSPSPIKSSPVPPPQAIYQRPSPQHHPPELRQTPQQLQALPVGGHGAAPGGLIPQKHDLSSAPSPTLGLGAVKAFPPSTAFTPTTNSPTNGDTGKLTTDVPGEH